VICQQVKERAISEPTATPHLITTDSLQGVADDVNLLVPLPRSLKRTLQRARKAEALHTDPDLATANDRSLLTLHIPESLCNPFKVYATLVLETIEF
jgi:hypothetical protein